MTNTPPEFAPETRTRVLRPYPSPLHEVAREVHALLEEMFYLRGASKRVAALLGWCFLYDPASQDLLQALSRYSRSSVSAGLKELAREELVRRARVVFPDGAWEYRYALAGTIAQLNQRYLQRGADFFQGTRQFLARLRDDVLPGLSLPPGRDREDKRDRATRELVARLTACVGELLPALDLLSHVSARMAKALGISLSPTRVLPGDLAAAIETLAKCRTPAEVQRTFLNFFETFLPRYRNRDPILARVCAVAYIHREFTQARARHLTDYSAGAVSRATRQLVAMGVLERAFLPGTHTHVYRVGPLVPALIQLLGKTGADFQAWEARLAAVEERLEALAGDWQDHPGHEILRARVAAVQATLAPFVKSGLPR